MNETVTTDRAQELLDSLFVSEHADISLLIAEALEGRERIGNFESWCAAARQFMWAHEHSCPRRTEGTCNCGLDSFLSRPRPFVESYKQRIAELTASLATAQAQLAAIKGKVEWAYQADGGGVIEHCMELPARHWCEQYPGYTLLQRTAAGPWKPAEVKP